jgi:short-chain fatty acids transporter
MSGPADASPPDSDGPLAGLALRFTAWSERWIPDAFVFALVATAVVVGLGLGAARASVAQVVLSWGKGFWGLATFTLHMSMIIVAGHVLATAPATRRLIIGLSQRPQTARHATTLVAVFAMATAWLNWGFSLIVSALLAREIARRRPDADYRALGAASFLGLGSVWAQGLSGSAALQMASPAMLPSGAVRDAVAHGGLVPGGVLPLSRTIFLWQSWVSVIVEILVVGAVVWLSTPSPLRSRSAASLGVNLDSSDSVEAISPLGAEATDGSALASARGLTPGERLERSRAPILFVCALAVAYLTTYLWTAPDKLAAIDIGPLNLAFLTAGMLLHGTPARVIRAVREATPAVWGVLLQFPFYAGISGVITGTRLNAQLASTLLRLSTPLTLPPIVAAYSAVLGVFVPSGGSKWIIEAPYVLEAAHGQHVHLGWMVCVYDLGEALANLVQPFWMLPTLAILGLKARDVMGFTLVVFLALVPVVLALVTALGATLSYPV